MKPMTERDAQALTAEQATELVRIMDLQARWETHPDDTDRRPILNANLRARQRAHDQFQAAWHIYTTRHCETAYPAATRGVPDLLGRWCRVLRIVFRRATGGNPARVMANVYDLADRMASRREIGAVSRIELVDLPASASELDRVVAWCEALRPPARPAAAG